MKISCNIIKDILPLYAEGLASEESRKIIEDHIETCDSCKGELEEMKSATITPIDTDIRPLEKVRDKMRRKKFQTIIFTTMITLIIAMVIMAFVTAPDYLNDTSTVSIVKNPDGTVVAYFDEAVSGYDIEKRFANEGYVYDITTWNSIWTRNFLKTELGGLVLNPDGEDVESVYYYHTDGETINRLIYGKNQYGNGGALLLPRLALAYYIVMAVGIIGICLVLIFIFRNFKKIKDVLIKFMFLPISYIIGHILVKGFTTSSYSMERDFLAIILVMTGVYAAILLAMNIVSKSNKRSR